MDLSWCIICDNRIVDDELSMIDSNDSLYCSQDCRLKDQQQQQDLSTTPSILTEAGASPPLATTPVEATKSSITIKPWMTKKSAKHHIYRFNAPTTIYPWIPLYRKRHTYKRCCQPTVAGSPATATGILS